MSVLPKLVVNESGTRACTGSAHSDVRHEDNLRTKERSSTDVLEDVIVVANENAAFPAKESEGGV